MSAESSGTGSGTARPAAPGRVCPLDYRYETAVFARPAEFTADVLYVAGGVYGNVAALDAIEAMAERDCGRVMVVLNGDCHWFDAEPDWFAEVERRIAPHLTMRGNIETELARERDIGAGCGCVYPDHVSEEIVARSNSILTALRASAPRALARACADRAMYRIAQVGGLRVGIVHGDAESLGGWRFDRPALDAPAASAWLQQVHASSSIDVFASTHTCTAALRDFALPTGRLTVINNGAAGMPNFKGCPYGLVSRIAASPSEHALYGLERDGVHIQALPLRYHTEAFMRRFLARWPAGSPAHASYHQRLTSGPPDTPEQAQPLPGSRAV